MDSRGAGLLILLAGCSSPDSNSPAEASDAIAATEESLARVECLIERGGCPVPPSAPPPCPAGLSARPLSEVLAAPENWTGKHVAIRGPLRKGGTWCTLMFCVDGGCCNHCGSRLVLGKPGPPGDGSLSLENEQEPKLFACHGDESLVCCALKARGQEVIARGTFSARSDDALSAPHTLQGATVCAP